MNGPYMYTYELKICFGYIHNVTVNNVHGDIDKIENEDTNSLRCLPLYPLNRNMIVITICIDLNIF